MNLWGTKSVRLWKAAELGGLLFCWNQSWHQQHMWFWSALKGTWGGPLSHLRSAFKERLTYVDSSTDTPTEVWACQWRGFFLPLLRHADVPKPGIEPTAQQRTKPQWQCQMLNPVRHKGYYPPTELFVRAPPASWQTKHHRDGHLPLENNSCITSPGSIRWISKHLTSP